MYFIAYHKAHERGPYWHDEFGRCHFQSAKKSILERSIGNTVFVIQGWRFKASAPTRYALVHAFTPEGQIIDDDEGQYHIEGPATRLYPIPELLNDRGWFNRLFQQQRNFSLGFNTLTDEEAIFALKALPYMRVEDAA